MTKTYVGYLRGVLVGLSNLGVFTAEIYHNGCVYGILHYGSEKEPVCVDLETGLVRELTKSGKSYVSDVSDDPRYLVPNIQKALGLDEEPRVVRDDVLCKLISAMLSHRVSGEKIIQGLKLDKINIPVKLVENYLGGWSVSQKPNNDDEIPDVPWDISVTEFIRRICTLLLRKE